MHPGQATFFEYKHIQNGRSLLATANQNLDEVFIWDCYNKRENSGFEKRDFDEADFLLRVNGGFEIDNIRWRNEEPVVCVSMSGEKTECHQVCLYDLQRTQKGYEGEFLSSIEDYQLASKKMKTLKTSFKANKTVQVPFDLNYFCLDDKDDDIFFATSGDKKFRLDIRDPDNLTYFTEDSKESFEDRRNKAPEDIMAEFNQNNLLIFVNSTNKKISVFDVRKVD